MPISPSLKNPNSRSVGSFMNWSSYAQVYDLMASHNPEYQKLLDHFDFFSKSKIDQSPKLILDLGAGTGNFSIRAAQLFPNATILHVEPDPGMIQHAKIKAHAKGIQNIQFIQVSAQEFEFPDKIDFLICVHALYTFEDPQKILKNLSTKILAPNSPAFFCDLGRKLDIPKWRKFLFSYLVNSHGLLYTLKVFWIGRPVQKHNKQIEKYQELGTYWLHSNEEFCNSLEEQGFFIESKYIVYLGQSDLVFARSI